MPLYAMNANHEMDSHGIPYLDFLATKQTLGPGTGHAAQPQETSYFALVSDRYQVVGIDTAFHGNGRYQDGARVPGCARASRLDGTPGARRSYSVRRAVRTLARRQRRGARTP